MEERNLNFDEKVERKGTDCLKYDFARQRGMPEDVLPLWVADMDFKTSSFVEDAVADRVRHGIFGYSETGQAYFQALAGWMKRHHNWETQPQWLIKNTRCCICPGYGGKGLYESGGCGADSAAGLLSFFRSDSG